MGIEHRQQSEADARLPGSGCDATSHLGWIGIRGAVRGVMQIVELGDRSEARLQHLGIELGRDRLHLLRPEPLEEAVHHLPPGPEAVPGWAGHLGQARHAALESVAVQIGETGQADGVALGGGTGLPARLDRGDDARLVDLDHHVPRPALWQQRGLEKQFAHRRTSMRDRV